MEHLKKTDIEIFTGINSEIARQQNVIELIASENIVSRAVLEQIFRGNAVQEILWRQ